MPMVVARNSSAQALLFELSPPLNGVPEALLPSLNWWTSDRAVTIEAHIPDLLSHSLKITFVDGVLELIGQRKSSEYDAPGRTGLHYNGFRQRISLSKSLDWENTRTHVEGDSLTIQVPFPKNSRQGLTFYYSVDL